MSKMRSRWVNLSDTYVFTGDVQVPTPATGNNAVNRSYVDTLVSGLGLQGATGPQGHTGFQGVTSAYQDGPVLSAFGNTPIDVLAEDFGVYIDADFEGTAITVANSGISRVSNSQFSLSIGKYLVYYIVEQLNGGNDGTNVRMYNHTTASVFPTSQKTVNSPGEISWSFLIDVTQISTVSIQVNNLSISNNWNLIGKYLYIVRVAGAKGDTGLQGLTGAQGVIGIDGLQGVSGPQGNDGVQGATGFQGSFGGPQGFTGPQGLTGSTGVQGSQGPSSFYNENLLLNGNFEHWRDGNGVSSSTDVYFSSVNGIILADNFIAAHQSLSNRVFGSRSTNVPSTTFPSRYSMQLSCTADDTGLSSATYIATQIEGHEFAQFRGQTFTLSFWVMSSVTGTYSIAFKNGKNLGSSGLATRSYVTTYTIDSANTWEKKTITVTHDTTGTWNYTEGLIGLHISWGFSAVSGASGRTGTLNSWQSANVWHANAQTNAFATNGNTVRLAQVKFELGSSATDWVQENPSSELYRLNRYLEYITDRSVTGSLNSPIGTGIALSTTNVRAYVQFGYPKAVAGLLGTLPDSQVTDGVSFFTITGAGFVGSNYGQNQLGATTEITVASGLTQFRPYIWQFRNVSGAKSLKITAQLIT